VKVRGCKEGMLLLHGTFVLYMEEKKGQIEQFSFLKFEFGLPLTYNI